MKATEAREIAEGRNKRYFRENYEKVLSEIKTASIVGKLEIDFYSHLPESVIERLKEDGFKVNLYQSGYNETSLKIKW